MNINKLIIFLTVFFTFIFNSQAKQSQSQEITYKYLVFTEQCYDRFFQKMDFFYGDCLKISFSKFLGYGLVLGGAIVKFPQLIKIIANKSVYGISFQSIFLQGLTNWVSMVYSWFRGNPFSIYGQNVFLLFQNLLIMGLFMPFGDKAKLKYFIPLLLFGIGMGVTADPTMWPSQIINGTMYLQIIFFSTARFSQIYEIWRNKSTGTLSFITFFLIFIGNIARLFTIMVEADNDWIFKFSVMTAAFLNGFICTQFILYWNNTGKQKQE